MDRQRRPPGSAPGAIAVPSGRTRQSSIRSTSSRSTATASLSRTISARARDGGAWPSPSSLRSHRKVPAWRSGSCRASLPPVRAAAGRQRFGRRDAIDPAPIEDGEAAGKLVAEGDIDDVAALEPKFGPSQRPDRRGRAFRAEGKAVGFGLQRQRGAALGEPGRRPDRAQARPRPSPAISSRRSSGNLGLAIGPMRTIFCCICPSCDALPRCCQKGPFFCCGGVGSCYKPAARGIAAGYGCFSRGRGGTGRRAGFRFQ